MYKSYKQIKENHDAIRKAKFGCWWCGETNINKFNTKPHIFTKSILTEFIKAFNIQNQVDGLVVSKKDNQRLKFECDMCNNGPVKKIEDSFLNDLRNISVPISIDKMKEYYRKIYVAFLFADLKYSIQNKNKFPNNEIEVLIKIRSDLKNQKRNTPVYGRMTPVTIQNKDLEDLLKEKHLFVPLHFAEKGKQYRLDKSVLRVVMPFGPYQLELSPYEKEIFGLAENNVQKGNKPNFKQILGYNKTQSNMILGIKSFGDIIKI